MIILNLNIRGLGGGALKQITSDILLLGREWNSCACKRSKLLYYLMPGAFSMGR